MSEIDDIFVSKGRLSKSALPVPSSSTSENTTAKSKGKKRKSQSSHLTSNVTSKPEEKISTSKRKRQKRLSTPEVAPDNFFSEKIILPSKKPLPPETVLDPSAQLLKKSKTVSRSSKSIILKQRVEDVDADFKDSRGSGSRRKTEEGWTIYKEDELGIGKDGGDTPLCPFDCECCF